jgi:hypothetical protein
MQMKDSKKGGQEGVPKENVSKILNDDMDALFKLPLAEFTGARNVLATQLKKSGRGDEAASVKALAKPSVSAWAVNQLYWNHREVFNRLIALGERFHRAQKSGKVADMREVLDARREVLSQLSDVAASVLQDAGHSPAPDTIHRITTTLEGMSVYGSRSDGPRPGRLTQDVDPPGFESFGSFVPRMRLVPPAIAGGSTSAKRKQSYPLATAGGADHATTKTRQKIATHDEVRQVKETRKTKIAAAKISLQEARRSLTESRARAQALEAAQKKADADAKKAEKLRRDVEDELRKAKAASEEAAKLARGVAAELKDAARALDDAEGTVEKASKELESLSRESSGR